MIILHVTYRLKESNAREYVEALEASGIPQLCREEAGNIRYDYFYSAAFSDQVLLVEQWKDAESLEFHKQTEHFKGLGTFQDRFVKEKLVERFFAEEFK